MPDETRQEAKLRRIAMRKANKEKNLYATVASPYLAAVRTLELAKGYADLEGIISDYDEIIRKRDERHDKERMEFERIAQERKMTSSAKILKEKWEEVRLGKKKRPGSSFPVFFMSLYVRTLFIKGLQRCISASSLHMA